MAYTDWNWRLAADRQDLNWDCSAQALSWSLRAIGRTETEYDVIAGLGPSRISPEYGLLDASGAGLVEYLGELGITAENNPQATWGEIAGAVGSQPLVMGGRAWCHWTATRLSTYCCQEQLPSGVWLMNPAPGWMGVYDWLDEAAFDRLGSFSCVWFVSW